MSIRDPRTVMADIASLGLAPDAMALMMELAASLASSTQAAAVPKSKAALRTERWREKQRHQPSQNVTGDGCVTIRDEKTSQVTVGDARADDPAPFPTPALFLPPNPQPTPTPTHTPENNTRARKGRGSAGDFHRMPAGWRPAKPLPAKLAAAVAQWPPGKLENEIESLRDWAANAEDKNGKGRKLDWDLALHGWLRRADDDWRSRNGNNRSGGNQRAGGDSWGAVLRDVADGKTYRQDADDSGGVPLLEGMGGYPRP